HIDSEIDCEQVQRRMKHADMGFDAGEKDLAAICGAEIFHDRANRTTTEGCLFRADGYAPGNVGYGASQSLGILFGCLNRDAENLGALDQKSDVSDEPIGCRN